MPRQARLDFPGCLHHLINRGIERRPIFFDQNDYKDFKDTLGILIEEGGHKCYGWVLMPNHYHLLIETGREPISKLMSRLQTAYAMHFNKRHRRSGVLFQNRFKSIVCNKDAYFMELISYLHLNPLRAGLVRSFDGLANYHWSGHRTILGLEKNPWQSAEEVLCHFSKTMAEARRRYLGYMSAKKDIRQNLSGGGLIRGEDGIHAVMGKKSEKGMYDSRILGDDDFIQHVLGATTGPSMAGVQKDVDLEALIGRTAEAFNIDSRALCGGKKSSTLKCRARAAISYLASRNGVTLVDLAGRFCISQPAISKLVRMAERLVAEDEEFKRILGNIVI